MSKIEEYVYQYRKIIYSIYKVINNIEILLNNKLIEDKEMYKFQNKLKVYKNDYEKLKKYVSRYEITSEMKQMDG